MKRLFFFLTMAVSLSFFAACKNNDDDSGHTDDDPQYSITINSPNTDDKHVNDDIHIHVVFTSATGETVHHANVRIYNKDDNSVIAYDRSVDEDQHVHATTGTFEWHYDLKLDSTNNVTAHTDWIMEAKVWGHEDGLSEVEETLEFHVHPE